MKREVRGEENGITLIALVLIIIVLLILAGISISVLAGENGLLNKAISAKEKTETAQNDEMEKIVKMEALNSNAGDK